MHLGRLTLAAGLALAGTMPAQELPPSGVSGLDLVWASDAAGTSSRLYLVNLAAATAAVPVGTPVANVPSRWSHRRRNLGALETSITLASGPVLFTPMGGAPGAGAIHLGDARGGSVSLQLLATGGNPASYDLAAHEGLEYLFSAEDDGLGNTVLRGYSYQTRGLLTPLNPPTLTLSGTPSAYVSRIGVSEAADELHVPTVDGVHVVSLGASVPQMAASALVASAPGHPVTNPTSFDRDGTTTWICGTSEFTGTDPTAAGWMSWEDGGSGSESATYGAVPATPSKNWVPAAGAMELAVVSDGTDTYVYNLLREPPPGTFFIKPAAVGATRFLGSTPAETSFLACPDECGEPFAIPTVSGTRVAFETSFGPPFVFEPSDGGEKVNIIYSPLDSLGSATGYGLLATPAPLGGRISTKGMDRPIWSHDGTRVFASTSWFPGAPQVGVSGLEVLDVPAGVPVNLFGGPRTVVPAPNFPDQSILASGRFDPRLPVPALSGLTFYGGVFDDGLASLAAAPFGELGQKQPSAHPLALNSNVPNFRAIHPPAFEDATSSLVPVPGSFGARRVTFNHYPGQVLDGIVMTAAMDDALLVQTTGINLLAGLGIQVPVPTTVLPLPAGWITTSEFLSY